LLVPADYGLIGMATTYLSLVALINELGLGAAIITQRDLSEDQIRQINSVCVLLLSMICAACWTLPHWRQSPMLCR